MALVFCGIVLAFAAGLAIKKIASLGIFDTSFGSKDVTSTEFFIGIAICAVVVVPFVVVTGSKLALSNNLKYQEFWNGYEVSANKHVVDCHESGGDGPSNCQHDYRCDPWTQVIHHPATYDSKGRQTSPAYDETVTHYHHCPYATQEWNFDIDTTLGNYSVENTFPDNAVEWRLGHGIPGDVRQGTPPFWQAAHDRIAAGDPGPVTKKMTYDNYILASQSTVLHKYSDAVEKYKGLLPAPASTSDLYSFYYAHKAYFVGMDRLPGWDEAVMRFNAAFGSELQGDFHLVFVNANATSDPAEYAHALEAYWTGKQFGRDALSKNGLVVVVGVQDGVVAWSKAFTGMPEGNEGLLTDLSNLKGQPIDPDKLLGHPVGQLVNGKVKTFQHGTGAIESAVWGVNKFERVCMVCKGQPKSSGFGYLGSEIQPTTGQKAGILAFSFVLSLIVWAAFVAIGTKNERKEQDNDGYEYH